jgi:ABC-2 type transport system ATP-binding protein
MSQTMIQIDSLSHSYGARRALSDLTLSVDRGEIFGFLGPNGSGKTTLFRVLSTLIAPQSGSVVFHPALPDAPLDIVRHRDAIRQLIGVVFQSPSLDDELTAEENLRHHGHLYGLRGGDLAGRIDRMLERFSLADRRREYVKKLSGGMRRRVELAKGLLTSPQILLMDEPSTGIDPAARIEMWRLLEQCREQDGLTILLTTHLMDDADRCDRLAIMDQGKLVASGTPHALRDRVGGDVITLTSSDVSALRGVLAEKLAIIPEIVDETLRIERPRAHEFIPQLVEAAPGLIESVSVGKPTLEDVFIHVTGRRFRDDAGIQALRR